MKKIIILALFITLFSILVIAEPTPVLCDWYDADKCTAGFVMGDFQPCYYTDKNDCDNEWIFAADLLNKNGCPLGVAEIDQNPQDDDCGIGIVSPGTIIDGTTSQPLFGISTGYWEADSGMPDGDPDGAGWPDFTGDDTAAQCLTHKVNTKNNIAYLCNNDKKWYPCNAEEEDFKPIEIGSKKYDCLDGSWRVVEDSDKPKEFRRDDWDCSSGSCKCKIGRVCYFNDGTYTSTDDLPFDSVDVMQSVDSGFVTRNPTSPTTTTPKTTCGDITIGMMGASNTVGKNSGSPFALLKKLCPSPTEWHLNARSCASMSVQNDGGKVCKSTTTSLLNPLLSKNLDMIIINPSGNTCGNIDKGIKAVEDAYNRATAKGIKRVIFTTISPRNGKSCPKIFNDKLVALQSKLGFEIVDLTDVLQKGADTTQCGFCIGDGVHWTPLGDARVALKLHANIFKKAEPGCMPSTNDEIKKCIQSPQVLPGPRGPVVATKIDQKCNNEAECKRIDDVWMRFSPYLKERNEVYIPFKGWASYQAVYSGAPGAAPVPASSPGPTPPTPSSSNGYLICPVGDLTKLSTSLFKRCDRFRSIFLKHMKNEGLPEDMLMSIYALTYSESSCRTGAEMKASGYATARGGIMQVDHGCLNKGDLCVDDNDKAIELGIGEFADKFNKMKAKNPPKDEIFDFVMFSYNRGEGTANKALALRKAGKSLHDSMVEACKAFYPRPGITGMCGSKVPSRTNTERCCNAPGLGAGYPPRITSHFTKACSQLGGSVSASRGATAPPTSTLQTFKSTGNQNRNVGYIASTNFNKANTNIYIYFGGIGSNINAIYSSQKSNFNTILSGKNALIVIPQIPSGGENSWFKSGYPQMLNEIKAKLGISSTSSINFLAHSIGGNAVSNIVTSSTPSPNKILLLDACSFDWCTKIANTNINTIIYQKTTGVGNHQNQAQLQAALGTKPNVELNFVTEGHNQIPILYGSKISASVSTLPPTTSFSQPPLGAKTCDNVISTTLGTSSPRTTQLKSIWENILNSKSFAGKTWIGKLNSNKERYAAGEAGRITMVYAPCTTDLTKPVELMYYFHGIQGFSQWDLNSRIAPQAKAMGEAGRNIVIIFPELPWASHSLTSKNPYTNKIGESDIWRTGDSNLVQLHADVQSKLELLNSGIAVNIGYISMLGHSAGGAALGYAAERNNALSQIKPNKIVFSDADYSWFDSVNPDASKRHPRESAVKKVYDHYIKSSNAELFILVQHPSLPASHQPTGSAIKFVQNLGSPAWKSNLCSYNSCYADKSLAKNQYSTPGAESQTPFKVPGTTNTYYVPLKISHTAMGGMSLAWTPN